MWPRATISGRIALLPERPPRATSGAGKAGERHFAAIIKSFFTALTPSTFSAIRVARSATFAGAGSAMKGNDSGDHIDIDIATFGDLSFVQKHV